MYNNSDSDKIIDNFNPGPAKLPQVVLKKIQKDLLNYDNTGISILETSHRSQEFNKIITNAKKNIQYLLKMPSNYEILFMQGGSSSQFSTIPLNLCNNFEKNTCDILITGCWSEKAHEELSKYINVNIVWSGKDTNYTTIGDKKDWKLNEKASFLYYCANETVHGVEFQDIPEGYENIPLVGDFSSCFLSEAIDVSKFGIIFAGAQKNVGSAGITIVIVRKDLLNNFNKLCPAMLNYTIMAEKNSMYNTPPCFSIYVSNLVIEWIRYEGGLTEMLKRKKKRSNIFYDLIKNSNSSYHCPVDIRYRSKMNVRLLISESGNKQLEKKFIEDSLKENFIGLNGHRNLGGLRISLYNSQPIESCNRLCNFMKKFVLDTIETSK